ncbi:winged helix-turn-helix transcriptional regulator [Glaciecola sp. MH2013]|nr:winged helix-turn-helix transcriptional regulator [Glaciecola sp. MH2013]
MAQSAVAAESLLKLLANRYRLQIMCSLVDGEKSAGELEDMLDISQSAVSQHLAKLRDSKVVATEKRGQMVFYKLASVEVNAILSTLYLIYCNK